MAKSNPLDPEILAAALAGLQQKVQRLNEQIAAVRNLMGQRGPGRPPKNEETEGTAATQPRKKRTMSAAGRKRIAEAQKKRWAAVRKAQ
jgi:hypothetical protein